MQQTRQLLGSLRYRRPYWMMFISNKSVDNWRIYTVQQKSDHQRTEMLYQAWLGGLDRPYMRPRCMATQPLWLEKKRYNLKKPRLDGAQSPMEKYVLDWQSKFRSFQGTLRPKPDDLHVAFDLVESPLDLSYACQLLAQCRTVNNIALEEGSFPIFIEACLRVDRMDVVKYAFENAKELGFLKIDENCKKFVAEEQTWYRLSPLDNLYYPLDQNAELNKGKGRAAATAAAADGEEDLEDELAKLQAELDALGEK